MEKTSNKIHDYLQLLGDFKARDSVKLRWVLDFVRLCHMLEHDPLLFLFCINPKFTFIVHTSMVDYTIVIELIKLEVMLLFEIKCVQIFL